MRDLCDGCGYIRQFCDCNPAYVWVDEVLGRITGTLESESGDFLYIKLDRDHKLDWFRGPYQKEMNREGKVLAFHKDLVTQKGRA